MLYITLHYNLAAPCKSDVQYNNEVKVWSQRPIRSDWTSLVESIVEFGYIESDDVILPSRTFFRSYISFDRDGQSNKHAHAHMIRSSLLSGIYTFACVRRLPVPLLARVEIGATARHRLPRHGRVPEGRSRNVCPVYIHRASALAESTGIRRQRPSLLEAHRVGCMRPKI